MAGNLLLVTEQPGRSTYYLMQYSQSGTQLSSQVIPQPPGQTGYQSVSGVTVDSTGNFDVYNGGDQTSNESYLSTYSPSTGTWTHQTYPGWPGLGNIYDGTLGSLGQYVYASDLGTNLPQTTPTGIIRFNTTGGAPTAFAPNVGFYQLTVGLDGLVYGLTASSTSPYPLQVQGYDPNTFNLVKTVTFPYVPYYDAGSLAVDASGQIFLADKDGYVIKTSPNGTSLAALQLSNGATLQSPMDMALDSDGQIAIGDRGGNIYLTDESLKSYRTISTGEWQAFVTFEHYIPATVPPTVQAGTNATINAGGTFSGTGSFSDPAGVGQTFTATVNYGDGSGTQPLTLNPDQTFNLSHVYRTVGQYAVTVSVTDGVGSPGTGTFTVSAVTPPPTAVNDSYSVLPGNTLTVAGVPSSSGALLRYGFDEASSGSVTAQDSGAAPAAPGSFSGAATRTSNTPGSGSPGALDLSAPGNNVVSAGYVAKLDNLGALTLTGWISLRGTPSDQDVILSDDPALNEPAGDGGWDLRITTPYDNNNPLSASNFAIQFGVAQAKGGYENTEGGSSTALSANGQWVFVAATYDANGLLTFYRGDTRTAVARVGNQTIVGLPLGKNTAPFEIGGTAIFPTTDYTPPAWLDDLRVYGSALTAAQLEQVRTQDLGSGVLANDTSPSGRPLTAAQVAGPAHGSLALNPDGSFTYTPANGFTGTDSFTYVASDGTSVSNPATVTINVVQPAPQILDDGGAGFAETGTGWQGWGSGYGGAHQFAAPAPSGGPATATASWQAAGLPAGSYVVQATWEGSGTQADNATYLIYDGATLVQTVTVNQRINPSGTAYGGRPFQVLATVPISSGTLRVVLGNNADSYVDADAVRVDVPPPANPPPTTVPAILDDGTANFAETGTGWQGWSSGFGGEHQYVAPAPSGGPATATASWQATGLAVGSYVVQATWEGSSAHADNVRYLIYDGAILLQTVTVNQQVDPVGTAYGNRPFQTLAIVNVSSGTLRVVLANNADSYVDADAVRIDLGAPVYTGPMVLDDLGSGYQEYGSGWQSWQSGYGGEHRYVAPAPTGQYTAYASWEVSAVPAGNYVVQVTWEGSGAHADNARFQIEDGALVVQTVTVNQQVDPSGAVYGNRPFQTLATVHVTTGILRVVLTNIADGYVDADAVRIASAN